MSKEQTYERPWVKKIKTGEYLYNWKGYNTIILIGGPYSEKIGIGEEKFIHCIGFFGDVSWWIKAELDKLTEDEETELEWMCRYKSYINKEGTTHEKVKLLSEFYGCETFHIYRTGDKEILTLINTLDNFHNRIENSSKNCLDPKTIGWKEKPNKFKIIKSFNDYINQTKDEKISRL